MADPLVVTVMRQFRASLFARELAQMQRMARQWLTVESQLDAQIAALAQDLADEKAAGKTVSLWKVQRMGRYQTLLHQTREQMDQYSQWSLGTIRGEQAAYSQLGIDHAIASIQASYPGRIGPFFNRLAFEAVENMVGLTGDGSPLAKLLRDAWGDGAARMTQALINGTALGWNPRKTARAMSEGLEATLQRHLTIARTEQIRVYRASNDAQYQASGVVESKIRICDHSDRVCAACLMAEGEEIPLGEQVADHPQGRCSTVPKVIGQPAPQWVKGADWFRDQGEQMQRSILGPGKYDAWRAGQFDLDQLVTRRENATWGASVTPTPLSRLIA